MKIASILPYKENYTQKGAGAVALWISDFIRDSVYKKNTYIIGSTNNRNYLTKNYLNINIDNINSKLNSTTKEYSNKTFWTITWKFSPFSYKKICRAISRWTITRCNSCN